MVAAVGTGCGEVESSKDGVEVLKAVNMVKRSWRDERFLERR